MDDDILYEEDYMDDVRRRIHRELGGCRDETFCFTGFRPQKLPPGMDEDRLESALTFACKERFSQGSVPAIVGMAVGVDLIAACAAIKLRDMYPLGHKRVYGFVPCLRETKKRGNHQQALYNWVAHRLDGLFVLRRRSVPSCYQERNQLMVDYSSALIAVYDHTQSGGTRNTLDYAKKIAPSRPDGFEITLIDPRRYIRQHGTEDPERLQQRILAAQQRERAMKDRQDREIRERKAARLAAQSPAADRESSGGS